MRRAAVLAAVLALLPLGGCITIAEIRTEGAKPEVHVAPGGLVVSRGKADAMSVSQRTLGFFGTSWILGFGWLSSKDIRLDPQTCGAAIIYADKPARGVIAHIADDVRAECPATRKELPK